MRYFFTLFVLIYSISLSALESEKLSNAIMRSIHENKISPNFHFEQLNDPGDTKVIDEMNASHPNKKVYGPYHLVLNGFNPGTVFELFIFNLSLSETPEAPQEGYVDKNGVAWITRGEKKIALSNLTFLAGGVMPGEPVIALIVLKGNDAYIATHLIPEPLEAYDKEGRHVSFEIISWKHPCFLMHGDHFKPKELISLSFYSGNGVTSQPYMVNADGTFIGAHVGYPELSSKDKEMLHIATKEQAEPLTLNFDWKMAEVNRRMQQKPVENIR